MICTVTGTLKDLTGAVLTNTKVVFYRSGITGQDGDTVIPQYAEAISNGSGEINVNLYSGEYTAEAVSLNGAPEQFTVGVPDQASAVLSDLIDQNPPLTPSTLTDTIAARDAALQYRNDAQGAAATAAADAANGVRSEFEALEAQAEAHEAGALGAKVAAETAAASAVSVVQQDLSALTFDIPAGAVAITPIDPYAHGFVTWPVHGNQSWRSEAPSTGAYLGVAANETAARAISGAADGDHYWNSADKKVYELAVTSGQTEVFRAGSANFPTGFALAIGSYVYLLDASSDKHIWRVEDLTGYTINALTFVSGQLWIGTTAGVIVLDYATGETTVAVKYDTTTTPAIVHNTVNTVAATVLPDAPIKNGVPVPTISAFTNVGVSVIRDDGSVVSGGVNNASWYVRKGFFDEYHNLWVTEGSQYSGLQQIAVPPFDTVGDLGLPANTGYGYPSQNPIASGTYGTNISAPRLLELSPVGATRIAGGKGALYCGSSTGLSTVFHSPNDITKSMVAYQADQFSMPPALNPKGAFLCEQGQAGTLVGANIENSTFTGTGALDGWTLDAAAINNNGVNQLDVTSGAATNVIATKTITGLTIGQWVKVQMPRVDTTKTSAIFAGTLSSGYASTGVATLDFQATAATQQLQIRSGDASENIIVTGVTVDVATPDRSVNGKGLIINGSLTQDADGWVSGFSAANYLEQPYNSGLDAGTGAFQRHLRLKMNANTTTETVFERDSATSAQRETLTVTAAGYLAYAVDDGTTVRTATGTVAIGDSTEHDVIVGYDGAGGVFIKLDGEDYASATGAALLTMTNAASVLRIGLNVAGANPLTNGSVRRLATEMGNSSANQNKVKAAWIGDNVAGTFQDMWFDPQTKLQHVLTDTYYYALDENGAVLSDKTEPNTGSWTKLAASPFGVVRAA